MSLSKSELKSLIKSKIIELVAAAKPDSTELDKHSEAMADAIVSHVKDKLEVSIPTGTVVVTVVSGVPTMNPAPIPCTIA